MDEIFAGNVDGGDIVDRDDELRLLWPVVREGEGDENFGHI